MSKWRVDLNGFPNGAEGALVKYRRPDSTVWTELAKSEVPRFEVTLPDNEPQVIVAVHAIVGGKVVPEGVEKHVYVATAVEDRTATTSITFEAPKVKQQGPTLEIVTQLPEQAKADDYEIEVRSGETGDDPDDSLQVGFVAPGETITAYAYSGADQQDIHTRAIRKADGDVSGWTTTTTDVISVTDTTTEDHSTDFSGGTLEEDIPNASVTPLTTAAGGVGFIQTFSLDSYGASGTSLDDLAAVSLDMVAGTPEEGTYTTDTFQLPIDHEPFMLEIFPQVGTTTRANLSLDDLAARELQLPDEDESGNWVDNRLKQMALTLDGDDAPLRMDIKVASEVAAAEPTFTDVSFLDYYPGKIIPT